jgi:hypothetical protein
LRIPILDSESSNGSASRPKVAGVLLLVLATAVVLWVTWRAHAHRVADGQAPHWDESLHLLRSALVAEDLRSGDPWALAYDVGRMNSWPPLQPLTLGGVFALGGDSLAAGRFLSLLCFALLIAVAGILSHRLAPRPAGLAPAVTIVLLATSYPLAALSGQVMLEPFAVLALAVVFLAFDIDQRRGSTRASQLLLALASIGAMLSRLNAGVLVWATLAIDAAIELRRDGWRGLWRRRGLTFLVIAAFAIVWFSAPGRLPRVSRALVSIELSTPDAPSGPLFAPWAIAAVMGWPALPILALVLVAWRRWWARPTVRFLAIAALAYLAIVAVHNNQRVRHVVLAALPLAVLAGWIAAGIARRQPAWARPGGLLAGVALLAALRLPDADAALAPRHNPSRSWSGPAAAVAAAAGDDRFFLLGERLLPASPPRLDWLLVTKHRLLLPSRTGSIGEVGRGATVRAALARLRGLGIELVGLERAAARPLATDHSRSFYVGLPNRRATGATAAEVAATLDGLALRDYPVVLLVTRTSPPWTVTPEELRTILTTRGFSAVRATEVEGNRVERFEAAATTSPVREEAPPPRPA